MARHGPEEIAAETRRVRRLTRASLMSDTKWRKAFAALDRPELGLRSCVWKIVGRADPVPGHMPRAAHLFPPHPWIDTLDFGPIPLRAIEWLLLPRHGGSGGPGGPAQAVESAAAILDAIGRFPIVLDGRGLTITGHLPADRPA